MSELIMPTKGLAFTQGKGYHTLRTFWSLCPPGSLHSPRPLYPSTHQHSQPWRCKCPQESQRLLSCEVRTPHSSQAFTCRLNTTVAYIEPVCQCAFSTCLRCGVYTQPGSFPTAPVSGGFTRSPGKTQVTVQPGRGWPGLVWISMYHESLSIWVPLSPSTTRVKDAAILCLQGGAREASVPSGV